LRFQIQADLASFLPSVRPFFLPTPTIPRLVRGRLNVPAGRYLIIELSTLPYLTLPYLTLPFLKEHSVPYAVRRGSTEYAVEVIRPCTLGTPYSTHLPPYSNRTIFRTVLPPYGVLTKLRSTPYGVLHHDQSEPPLLKQTL
jgi:hypothetical protein